MSKVRELQKQIRRLDRELFLVRTDLHFLQVRMPTAARCSHCIPVPICYGPRIDRCHLHRDR